MQDLLYMYVFFNFFLNFFLFREQKQKVGKNLFFGLESGKGCCLFSFGELYFTYKPFNVLISVGFYSSYSILICGKQNKEHVLSNQDNSPTL